MLGEVDLIHAPLVPGDRMASMMTPALVFDGAGLELALGAAGGSRLRTALVGVLGAILHGATAPQDAVDRPRFHPVGATVNAEPGVDEAFLESLESAGRTVRRGPRAITTSGASAPSAAPVPAQIRVAAAPSVSSADALRPPRRERRLVF